MSNLEFDHVVLFVTKDAPEAQAVEAAGLKGFGGVTRHGEMGTASTAFFFGNLTYLELFWLDDEAKVDRALGSLGLNMAPRMHWREQGAAPFGLMLRSTVAGETPQVPFPTKIMEASWMPPGIQVRFNGETLHEPYYGVVPEPLSYRGFRQNIEDVVHPLGVKNLSRATFTLPTADRSNIAKVVKETGLVRFEDGPTYLLTLTFDGGQQGKEVDLQPTLPLKVIY
jgi:hypothetical protein